MGAPLTDKRVQNGALSAALPCLYGAGVARALQSNQTRHSKRTRYVDQQTCALPRAQGHLRRALGCQEV